MKEVESVHSFRRNILWQNPLFLSADRFQNRYLALCTLNALMVEDNFSELVLVERLTYTYYVVSWVLVRFRALNRWHWSAPIVCKLIGLVRRLIFSLPVHNISENISNELAGNSKNEIEMQNSYLFSNHCLGLGRQLLNIHDSIVSQIVKLFNIFCKSQCWIELWCYVSLLRKFLNDWMWISSIDWNIYWPIFIIISVMAENSYCFMSEFIIWNTCW